MSQSVIFEVDYSGSVLFQQLLGSKHPVGITNTKYRAGVQLTLAHGHVDKDQNGRVQGRRFCSQGRVLVRTVLLSPCPSPFGTTVLTSHYSS